MTSPDKGKFCCRVCVLEVELEDVGDGKRLRMGGGIVEDGTGEDTDVAGVLDGADGPIENGSAAGIDLLEKEREIVLARGGTDVRLVRDGQEEEQEDGEEGAATHD